MGILFRGKKCPLNIKAENFLELHQFFGSIYSDIEANADKVAERLRQLQEFAPSFMEDYIQLATVSTMAEVLSDRATATKSLMVINKAIFEKIKTDMQDLGKDEATRNMLAAMVEQMEKTQWFLRSYTA